MSTNDYYKLLASSSDTNYFKEELPVKGAENCERVARAYENDIVNLVLSPETEYELKVECVQRVAHAFIYEMSQVRHGRVTVDSELNDASERSEALNKDLELVNNVIDTSAHLELFGFKIPETDEHVNFFKDFDAVTAQTFSEDDSETFHSPSPPSGRASPLLRTAQEAIAVPVRPHSVNKYEAEQQRNYKEAMKGERYKHLRSASVDNVLMDSSDSNNNNNNEAFTLKGEQCLYRNMVRRQSGSLKQRKLALLTIRAAFNKDNKVRIDDEDMQLTFLYCVYNSREVRQMVCAKHSKLRASDMAPLHPQKRWSFMCGLNKLSEMFNSGHIGRKNFLYSVRHLHLYNFVPPLTDEQVSEGLKRSASMSALHLETKRRRSSEDQQQRRAAAGTLSASSSSVALK